MTRPPSFTKAQRYDVATTYGAVILCQSCGFALAVDEMEIDHELAIIDGGAHELENWRPTCFGCNRRKGAREHRANCKAKRIASKHSGHEGEAKPMRKRIYSRPLRGRTSWPESRKIESRPFQRKEVT